MCLIVAVLGGIAIVCKPYFSPAIQLEGLNVIKHGDDTIRIAFIGDSWIEGHMDIDCVVDSYIENNINRPVVVRMAGISGLTSKYIYNCIFRNQSFRDVIEWGPDFCFVVAGINDSDRKMGSRYYKENMRLIINCLLDNHIVPVVLEIPSFDINYSYERRTRWVKMKYLFSMVLTWSSMNCIDEYRQAYIDLLRENNLNDQVITIWSNDWNLDGYTDRRCLYDEGLMHLNKKGYAVLDSCVANKILGMLK